MQLARARPLAAPPRRLRSVRAELVKLLDVFWNIHQRDPGRALKAQRCPLQPGPAVPTPPPAAGAKERPAGARSPRGSPVQGRPLPHAHARIPPDVRLLRVPFSRRRARGVGLGRVRPSARQPQRDRARAAAAHQGAPREAPSEARAACAGARRGPRRIWGQTGGGGSRRALRARLEAPNGAPRAAKRRDRRGRHVARMGGASGAMVAGPSTPKPDRHR